MPSAIAPIPAVPALPTTSERTAQPRVALQSIDVDQLTEPQPVDALPGLAAMRLEMRIEHPDAATEAARWQAQLLDGSWALSAAAAMPQHWLRFMPMPQAPWRWPGDHEQERGSAAQGDPSLALGLVLDGEPVLILLHWQQGLWMQLGARSSTTLQAFRAAVPAIATSLAAVPLRLRRCWLIRLTRPLPTAPAPAQVLLRGHGAWLLRAAAEISAVLRQRESGLSPANPAR